MKIYKPINLKPKILKTTDNQIVGIRRVMRDVTIILVIEIIVSIIIKM